MAWWLVVRGIIDAVGGGSVDLLGGTLNRFYYISWVGNSRGGGFGALDAIHNLFGGLIGSDWGGGCGRGES